MTDKFYAIVKFPEEISVAYHIPSLEKAKGELTKWQNITGYDGLKIVEISQKIIDE